MNKLIRFVQNYFWLLFGVLVAAGMSALCYSTGGKLLFTHDSYQYWAAAKSFRLSGEFLNAHGLPLSYFPPLFPFVLSFFATLESYFIFLLLLFLLNAYLIASIILGLKYSKPVALLAVAFYLTHVNVYLIGSFLWSEMLFLSLLFLLVILYDKIKFEVRLPYLMLFGLVAMLLCLQRNIGLFILIGWSVIAFKDYLYAKNDKLLVMKALVILFAITPICLWNIYHIANHGNYYRLTEIPLFTDIYLNLSLTATYLLKIFAPFQLLHLPAYANIGLMFILLLILFKRGNSNLNILIATYIILLSFTSAEHYGVDERFLSVIFPLVIINSSIFISRLRFYRSTIIISILMVLLFTYNAYRTARNIAMWHQKDKEAAVGIQQKATPLNIAVQISDI